jgi:signal transduction histidine kinase/DNA-binding CsgD family transcriptional regulator
MAAIADTPARSGAHGGLIGLIADLRQQPETRFGRLKLLDYARKRAGAQLGLLFRCEAGELTLVEQCGHAPRNLSISPGALLSNDGLFGSARGQSGLVKIVADHSDLRCLPTERAWTWHNGQILLCAVATTQAAASTLAVMALCSKPQAATKSLSRQAEQDILLCAALLASYLEDAEPETTGNDPAQVPLQNSGKGRLYIVRDHPPASIDDAALLQQVVGFYERGLTGSQGANEQEWYQNLLDDLKSRSGATGGALWLYSPSQQQFVQRAEVALDDAALIQDELSRIAAEATGSGEAKSRWPRVVTWSRRRMLIAQPLDVERERIGIVALFLKGGVDLTREQRLLLERLCHAAALIIRQQQQAAAQRQEALDEERSRIARDIHDGAIQQMAHVLHALEYAGRVVERQPGIARQEIQAARDTLLESLGSLRQSIASLLPARLEQGGLDEALDALLDEFRRTHPTTQVDYEGGKLKRFPLSLEAPVYRVVQEALNNISKHAQASKVTMRISSLPGLLIVQVSDDGVGFNVAQARRNARGQNLLNGQIGQVGKEGKLPHFGLRAMQERVEQAGGTFTLTSEPGRGTSIKASFPLTPLTSLSTSLTPREREVLRLLVSGATNRRIAEQLSVSIETVKSHMRHIMQKLGVKDRTQAAVLAARQQWV